MKNFNKFPELNENTRSGTHFLQADDLLISEFISNATMLLKRAEITLFHFHEIANSQFQSTRITNKN